jgi:hypothetical protein
MKTNDISRMIQSFIAFFAEEHMRLGKSIAIVFMAALLSMAVSCSKDTPKFGLFQNNTGSTDPLGGGGTDPFAGYPDFTDPTTSVVDPQTFVNAFDPTGGLWLDFDPSAYEIFADEMEMIRVAHETRVDEVLGIMNVLAKTSPYAVTHSGIYGLMEYLGLSMGYLMNQNTLDDTTGTDYQGNLYTFLNNINDADLHMKTDVYNLMYKIFDFLADRTWQNGTLETNMLALRQFLSDATTQNFTGLLFNFQEGMGKLLMRADGTIRYDDSLDPQGGSHGVENTKLGNAVSGVDYLLHGITDMIATSNAYDGAAARQNLYDMLREIGKLVRSLKGGSSPYYPAFKNLLKNLDDYYTIGTGTNTYDTSAVYNHQTVGTTWGTDNYYVNAELRNSLKEMWPSLAKLFIRERDDASDNSDYSIIRNSSTAPSNSRSTIEVLARTLHQLKIAGIDYSDTTNHALEPSLKKLVQYNAFGNTRPSTYNVSFLDHLLFTIGAGYNFGFLTRPVDPPGVSGEPYSNRPSPGDGANMNPKSYQHGAATGGILTLNDSLYALTNGGLHVTAAACGAITVLDNWTDSYNLGMAIRSQQGPMVKRSRSIFTWAGGSDGRYDFYIGYDYPSLLLLPAGASGDAGIPNGGQKAITPSTDSGNPGTGGDLTTSSTNAAVSNNDLRTYFPQVADGVGDANTATWIFSWIARACWDGAGPYYATTIPAGMPATKTFTMPVNGSRTVNIYYKANGEEYAYVYKKETSAPFTQPWEYYYPDKATSGYGNDVQDPNDTATPKQRYNRYRDTLKSDYYMVQRGQSHPEIMFMGCRLAGDNSVPGYCVPPMNPNGTANGYVDTTSPGHNKYFLADSTSFSASYFQFFEKVQEWTNTNIAHAGGDTGYDIIGNQSRECASQEEAMFRNYQWLMMEKKFTFIIPLSLFAALPATGLAAGNNSYVDSAIFMIIEANGIVGAATGTKNASGNGYWNLKGASYGEGIGTDQAGHRNNPDYGNSMRPGDSRVIVFASYFTVSTAGNALPVTLNNATLNPDIIYDNLLGTGHVLPDAVGANIYPVGKLGFVDQLGFMGSAPVSSTVAPTGRGFLTSDASYISRNKVLPIFVALAGALRDGTYYDASGSGYNYNYLSKKHKYPLRELLDGIMVPLSKPYLRMWDDTARGASSQYGKRWIPRIMAESAAFSCFNPVTNGYTFPDSYRPLNTIRTLASFLADQNTTSYYDGLIPIIADNTNLVTKLLSLLQRMGDFDGAGSPYADSYDPGGGILENVSQGLEQIVTAVQVDKGQTLTRGYTSLSDARFDTGLNTNRYGWMFWNGGGVDRRTAPVSPSPISVDLGVALDELIGDGTKGLSKFYNDHSGAGGWNNYDTALDALGQLLGNPATKWYMLADEVNASSPFYPNPIDGTYMQGNIINFLNKILTGVTTTTADRQALRHTLGIMMYRYANGTGPWTTNTELRDIIRLRLPETMTSFEGHYGNLLLTLQDMLDYNSNGTVDPDIMDYLIDLLVPGTRAEQVIPKMYELTSSESSWRSDYFNVTYPGYDLWKQLADICEDLAAK